MPSQSNMINRALVIRFVTNTSRMIYGEEESVGVTVSHYGAAIPVSEQLPMPVVIFSCLSIFFSDPNVRKGQRKHCCVGADELFLCYTRWNNFSFALSLQKCDSSRLLRSTTRSFPERSANGGYLTFLSTYVIKP